MSLMNKPLSLLLLGAALVACGGEDQAARDAVPAEAPAREPMAAEDEDEPVLARGTLNIADVLGTFEGTVTGLTFWHHPTLPQASGVLAANGAAGLYLIPLTEGMGASLDGNFNGGVAVSYGEGRDVIAAFDGDAGAIRFLSIAPVGGLFETHGALPMDTRATALCAAGRTLLAVMSDGRAVTIALEEVDGDAVTATPTALSLSEPVVDCAGSGSEAVFQTASGSIVDGDGVPLEGLTAARGAVDTALFSTDDGPSLVSLARGILVANGQEVAVVGIGLDAEPVRPLQIAGGSGNFGAVYRGGVIAMIAEGGELSLAPWLGLAATVPDLPSRTVSPLPDPPQRGSDAPIDLSVPESLPQE